MLHFLHLETESQRGWYVFWWRDLTMIFRAEPYPPRCPSCGSRFGSPVCTSRYLGLPDASGDALRCSCTPVAPGVRDLVENQINKNESMSNLAKQ